MNQAYETSTFANFELATQAYDHEIVASVLTNNGEVALFKRSQMVTGDCGLWHCITGFLDRHNCPSTHVRVEIEEEANIAPANLKLINSCRFYLNDSRNKTWCIHAFHFETTTKEIAVNWENDAARWCSPGDITRLNTVSWLSSVMSALKVEKHMGVAVA
ncbi:MAG: NUDIX domain-containing protein [Porticoccaceae bacterium]|nr:NUDIX domain-containing protein [Pseudomonadales bacterium]MCP5172162.1 NUDIX domain-containing protein [Pseudomonadales bacterium]